MKPAHCWWFLAVVLASPSCNCGKTPDGDTCASPPCGDAGNATGDAGGSSSSSSSSSSSGGTDAGSTCNVSNCATPRVCRLDTCIDAPAACTGDADCQGDSRCLTQECIPFGVGGETNPGCHVLIPLGVFTPAIQCEWQPTSTGTPCTNPCDTGEVCSTNAAFAGPYCTGLNAVADEARPCANPCTAPREVCMPDATGALTCQDPYRQLLNTPMVVDFNLDDDATTLKPSLVFASYGWLDGSLPSGSQHGVLRVVDGATCQTQFTVDGVDATTGLPLRAVASSSVALGDIDGDGRADIVAHAQGGGVWAFRYDSAQHTFVPMWRAVGTDGAVSTTGAGVSRWSSPSLADLDNDGVPEILMEGSIYNALGHLLGDSQAAKVRFGGTGQIPVVADVDLDGLPELVTGDQIYSYALHDWTPHTLTPMETGTDGLVAVGDFGPFTVGGMTDVGYPEVVVVGGTVRVQTIDGRVVFPAQPVPPAAVVHADGSIDNGTGGGGGAPTIGDFDGDGKAEFAEAGGRAYTVFDFDCLGSNTTCTSDAECPAQEHCPQAGRCSKSSTRCNTNTDCPAEEECFVLYPVAGHCQVTTATACTLKSQCPMGETCRPDAPPPRHCAPTACEGHGILWTQVSQDLSSNRTASSIFDFEGDGKVEAVYADECYLRVYDGRSGKVLFSQMHTSCTWFENPIVADVDGDLRSEMVVGSNENCGTAGSCFNNAFIADLGADGVPSSDDVRVDPIFEGLRCQGDTDCPGTLPHCVEQLCRCTTDTHCGSGFVCAPPIAGSTVDTSRVCRAPFRPDTLDTRPGITGVRVFKDQADRWVGSRPVWNQHAYSITNVGDHGEIPRSSQVARNWQTAGLNNFRQNVQGNLSGTDFPDVTAGGAFADECILGSGAGSVGLHVRACNRGTAPMGAGVPVTFYSASVAPSNAICTVSTTQQLAPGACETLGCSFENPPSGMSVTVLVRADDDGTGMGTRAECLEGNNGTVLGAITCQIGG